MQRFVHSIVIVTEPGKKPIHYLLNQWNDIIDACRRGDLRAQELAYRQTWRVVYPAVHNILRNREESEDIMQESFIKGFGKLKELKEPEKYQAWQKRIAVNLALTRWKQLRKDAFNVSADENGILLQEEEVELPVVSPELIQKHLAELAEGYRIVITLHLLEGMSHEEIGKSLGVVSSTSRSQYARAIAKLRQTILKEHEERIGR